MFGLGWKFLVCISMHVVYIRAWKGHDGFALVGDPSESGFALVGDPSRIVV